MGKEREDVGMLGGRGGKEKKGTEMSRLGVSLDTFYIPKAVRYEPVLFFLCGC